MRMYDFQVTGLPQNVDAARREIEQHIYQRTGNMPLTDPSTPISGFDLQAAASAAAQAQANQGSRPPYGALAAAAAAAAAVVNQQQQRSNCSWTQNGYGSSATNGVDFYRPAAAMEYGGGNVMELLRGGYVNGGMSGGGGGGGGGGMNGLVGLKT